MLRLFVELIASDGESIREFTRIMQCQVVPHIGECISFDVSADDIPESFQVTNVFYRYEPECAKQTLPVIHVEIDATGTDYILPMDRTVLENDWLENDFFSAFDKLSCQ